ncbi:unnamed protein product [Callosobruchus maculatus]|uniref:F-actin binding domain-containing protein n=1 Tax=Callosobruchus maculatus TaxID=64391 RepID=A0A653D517_CALMS|nr:unnamed protein product [Callosobruchus maculatus]
MVQMRRTTNKRGKTAPAPPKRTSLLSSCSSFRDSTFDDQGQCEPTNEDAADLNGMASNMHPLTASTKCDSESDLHDQTPDTDDSGAYSYPEASSGFGTSTSSFKRAPIMGNRGLEQRGKKGKKESPAVQVAALEVQNVRKAISRYGTLPKGARIGAYLESLRQNNMSGNEETPQSHGTEHSEVTPRSLSPRTNIRTQPQMIRSNSSSGVTTFHSVHPPSSPTSTKLGRNRNMTRNNSDVRSSLRSFKGNQGGGFRGGSPSRNCRSTQPSLADLEFPPPPTDLPPPPEEFDNGAGGGIDQVDCSTSIMTSSQELKKRIIPVSPLTTKKISREASRGDADTNAEGPAADVSTLQPSVEEASSRFGVSLKKREPSTDSGSSAKDPKGEDGKERSPQRVSLSLTSPSQEGKSPVSADTDAPALGSPLEPLPPPAVAENEGDDPDSEDNKTSKVFKNKLAMKEMELKLVAEIKERADQKLGKKESSPEPALAVSGICHDPVSQLVTELSQALNVEKEGTRSKLKKVETKKVTKEKSDDTPVIIDFKSRLRKVEKDDKTEEESDTNKRESTASSDSGNLKPDDCDDKRKSTGSISSLKRLWEPENSSSVQLSPKLSLKNTKSDEMIETSSIETSDESIKLDKSNKSDKKTWPPQEKEDKPVIPTKPPVKAIKPIVSRPAGSAIYATPIASNGGQSKPPIMAKPTNIENKTPEDDPKIAAADKTSKDNILEISQALETTLNSIKSNATVSTATWLQLSDKIGMLHGSCMDYADNVVPAHTKFHFRELLTRLESQARQLRSAGSRNSSENTRSINEVNNTIKDVVNVVFR